MFCTKKPNRASTSSSSSMASSLSSLLSHNSHPFSLSNTSPDSKHIVTRRPQIVAFSTHNESSTAATDSSNDNKNNNNSNVNKNNKFFKIISPPYFSERKSFTMATGELFLGLASRIIKYSNSRRISRKSGLSLLDEERSGRIGLNYNGDDYKERIGRVIEDEIEPDVIWEQRIKDIEAEKERPAVTGPGFSFSAAGLLFPYHLGVAQCLIEKGYIKETTPLAGASAGAIVAAVIASGATMQEALKATKVLAEDCRLKGTAFRLGAVLRDVLEKFLPDDVHIRSNGRVRVAVTQILWRPRGLLVDQFDSKEDLINAVFTSSFIPGYLAPRPATIFRNRVCIDGGLTLFMPPTSAAQTVRVCAFPASGLGLKGIGISPDCNPENRASPRELFSWALEPAEDHVLDRLFELGYLDASVWAEQNPFGKVAGDNGRMVENGYAL